MFARGPNVALSPGTTLGTYEVIAKLGEGGMGEVYRARDHRLGRDVALKILPDAFARDADRLQRFEREAHLLASLNHPNIATIHGIEETGALRALVLELVDGSTLAELVARGPLPVATALGVAKQIAEALEAAHQAGVVHRDLKPANIKVDHGRVKVLDFGLAKAMDPSEPPADASNSPTITSPLGTMAGVILGTAAYMAPEQARGEHVDEQADIWAFGCVLFEMLTGRAAFAGRSVSDIVAAILRGDPDWAALPPALHPRVHLLLERCLEKDVANRYHAIADARVDVQRALAEPAGAAAAAVAPVASRRAILRWTATGLVLGAMLAGVAGWMLWPREDRRTLRFSEVLPQDRVFTETGYPISAVSPDGSVIAYVANGRIFTRSLASGQATPIPGTDGAPTTPFFSPDGQFVGYWVRRGELRRIAVSGGTPVGIAKVTNIFGARWQADDTILYAADDGIWRVPASGGTPEALVRNNPGERVHGPQLLPGGETVLFTLRAGIGSALWEDAQIVAQSLRTGQRKTIRKGRDARYVPTGHLLYAEGPVLFALPFDVASLAPIGGPVPMVEGLRLAAPFPGSTGTANYDVTATGVLVSVRGEQNPPVPRQLVAVDRSGTATPLVTERRDYWRPRVSPDGSTIAVEVRDERGEQLWVVDLKSATTAPLSADAARNVFCTWTQDGRSVIFRSDRSDRYGMYRQPADGSTAAQLLFAATEDVIPGHVSHDGVLVYASGEQTGRRSIWTMQLSDGKPVEFLATPAMEHMPAFSPDGKWIAYASDETGRQEIYIRPYPNRDGIVRRVSEGGGTAPLWAPDGSELYFRSASGILVATPLRLDTAIATGRPRELFRVQGRFRTSGNAAAYDVEPNGRRFIMVTDEESATPAIQQLDIVLNWFEELKRMAPRRQ